MYLIFLFNFKHGAPEKLIFSEEIRMFWEVECGHQ